MDTLYNLKIRVDVLILLVTSEYKLSLNRNEETAHQKTFNLQYKTI